MYTPIAKKDLGIDKVTGLPLWIYVYEVDIKIVCVNPKEFTEEQVTEMHLKCLEENILQQPANWLWSHRRWKHKKPSATNKI